MKTWTKFTLASLFAVGMTATASADEITVYTALEEEEIAAYIEAKAIDAKLMEAAGTRR